MRHRTRLRDNTSSMYTIDVDTRTFEIQFDRLRRPYQMTTRELVEVLENLGRLPSDVDPAPLLGLVEHPVEEVRLYAVKNLAKLKQPRLLQFFFERGRKEPSTLVRREFVSAIGRLRIPEIIPYCILRATP